MATKKSLCPLCPQSFTPVGLAVHFAQIHPEALRVTEQATEIAYLKEEVERLNNELSAKLAESPVAEESVEETDQDRFVDLVDGIKSLTPAGKARLAEEIPGWTYQAPIAQLEETAADPVIEEEPAEVAVADTKPIRRIRVVVKA